MVIFIPQRFLFVVFFVPQKGFFPRYVYEGFLKVHFGKELLLEEILKSWVSSFGCSHHFPGCIKFKGSNVALERGESESIVHTQEFASKTHMFRHQSEPLII